MLVLTCIITTTHLLWISIVSAIFFERTGYPLALAMVTLDDSYRYPLASFVSVLPTLLFINIDRATDVGWRIRVIAHFFATFVFTLGSWIYLFLSWANWDYLVRFFIIFLIVFIIIYTGAYRIFIYQQNTLANKLNEGIKGRKLKNMVDED